jgi:zinc protease
MSDRAEHLGEAALFGGARYYWDRPLALQALTPADLRRVAETYLVEENLRLVVLVPKATPPLADAAKAAFHTDFDALGAAPAGAGTGLAANLYSDADAARVSAEAWGDPKGAAGLGMPQRGALKNGLTVVVLEDHRQPIAAISLHSRSGSGDDPPGREGLAGLTLRMLAGRMAAQAAQLAGPRRLTLVPEAQVTRDFMEIRFVGAADELSAGLQALAQALPTAPITEAEVGSLRQGALQSLQRADRDPDATSLDLFREKVYAGDPYAHRPDGTPGGLEAITADDLRGMAGSALAPDRLVLAVAGDVDAKAILRTAEKMFGGLSGKPSAGAGRTAGDAAAPAGPPSATAGAQPGEYSRQVAAAQSRIVVGAPASPILGAEFSDLRLLGAGLSLLAFEDLVFTQRAAFSVLAVPEGLRRGGSLAFEVVAAHNRRAEALFDLKRLLRRLAIEDLSDPDRRDLGRMLSGRDAAAAQGPQALASNLAYREAAGLDAMRYRDDFNPRTPTAARIKEMAERYLKPESWISVIVGPSSP